MAIRSLAVGLVGLGLLAGSASAALTPLDSSSFTHKFEMSGTTVYPDDASSAWTYSAGGGGSYSADQSGGFYSITTSGVNDAYFFLTSSTFQTDTTGASGATLEFRVKAISSTNEGAFGVVVQDGNGGYHVVTVGLNSVTVGSTVLDTSNNSDDYHVFRLARDAGSSVISIYRDGVALVNGAGETGTANTGFYFGDGTGGWNGSSSVDYVRWTAGGYSPLAVPEPASLSVLALGGLALVRRRRGA